VAGERHDGERERRVAMLWQGGGTMECAVTEAARACGKALSWLCGEVSFFLFFKDG
jgi:hypothetical protein